MKEIEPIQEYLNFINQIISLKQELDRLWEYHPDNPKGKNIEQTFNKISNVLDSYRIKATILEEKITNNE